MANKRKIERYIDRLYWSLLGRHPDPAGAAHWTQLTHETGDFTLVLDGILDGEEYRSLRRPSVDPAGLTAGQRPVRHDAIEALFQDQTQSGLPAGVDVVVPVCNAAGWLRPILRGYRALGVSPLFIVDSRSSDESLTILEDNGARCFTATGRAPLVESMLCPLIPFFGGEWILRLDDDELPSKAALQWIARHLAHVATPAVALPRYWVGPPTATGSRQISSCTNAGGSWGADHQLRLYRPTRVVAHERIHSPGFDAPFERAPAKARLYHFDWLVRGYEQRLQKIERYEAQLAGSGHKFARYHLLEAESPEFYDLEISDDEVLSVVSEELDRSVDRA